MKNILIILKKELKRFFTDYRMLIGIILPGILIFVIYTLMGGIMEDNFKPSNDYIIYIENEPDTLFTLPSEIKNEVDGNEVIITFTKNPKDLTKDEILDGIKNKEIHSYIIFEEGFLDKVISYETGAGLAPNVDIYINSTDETSAAFYQFYTGYLDMIEHSMSNKFDINRGNEAFDLATKEDASMMVLSMMLPLLLMTFLFSGCMGFCSESIAGEKERGTFATMLITPTKRYQIAIGKILALGIASLSSAVISFIGLIASLPSLMGGSNITLGMYGASTYIMFLLVIVVTVLLFTVILTMTSAYAKSVKEATTLASPIMIIVMLISVTGMIQRDYEPSTLMYMIPVYNSLNCFSGLLQMNISMVNLGVTIASNIVFIALGIFILAKMFNSERIMFNK